MGEFIVVFIVITALIYIYIYLAKEVGGGGCNCASCPTSKKSSCGKFLKELREKENSTEIKEESFEGKTAGDSAISTKKE
jgi:hypothetical protein